MSRHYGSTSSRGYGNAHQKLRKRWKPMVDAGQVQCHADLCLEERDGRSRWIASGTPWHLGHTPDRSGYTGPEHERCGASDGARRGNQNRPRTIVAALGPTRSPLCKACGKEYHYAAKDCMICGRHYHPSRGEQHTCSRACGVAYRRMGGYGAKPLPACEVCGKPCVSKGALTCSEACLRRRRDSQRKELCCERCGKKFIGISARYCSANCNALAYYYANREEVIDKTLDRYYAKQGRERPSASVNHASRTGMMAQQSRAW